MQSASTRATVHGVLRPARLIAEALVDGHNTEELVSRARKLGYPRDVIETVVAVCCQNTRLHDGQRQSLEQRN